MTTTKTHKCQYPDCPERILDDIPSSVCGWHTMLNHAQQLRRESQSLLQSNSNLIQSFINGYIELNKKLYGDLNGNANHGKKTKAHGKKTKA